jgi:hypothetical protein
MERRAAAGLKLDAAQVDGGFPARRQHLYRAGQIGRQPQFPREDIDGAQRQEAKARRGETARHIGDAVDHLMGGAVASGGDDGGEAFTNGLGGQEAGLAGCCGQAQGELRMAGIEAGAKSLRLLPSRRGIENDARLHQKRPIRTGTWRRTRWRW